MTSLLDLKIERTLDDYFASDRFKNMIRQRVKWVVQGFHPAYDMKDREAFTATVAARLRSKSRELVYLFGKRIWRKRMDKDRCSKLAEQIVTDFLRSEQIRFGEPGWFWGDGNDLADEEMSHWERI